jgi:Fic family protein
MNILDQDFYYLNSLEIISEIQQRKEQIDLARPLDKELEQRIIQKLKLDWNYNSNSIEGNSLDYGETLAFIMHGVTAQGKPLKDYLDLRGHNDAISFLANLVKDNLIINETDIRNLHEILLVEPYDNWSIDQNGLKLPRRISLGKYKTNSNHVITATGETHFYASPEDTPILMSELVRWYNSSIEEKKLHPVIISSIFHHQFTAIHPFDDGNGRMSRLLMNLVMMQHGFPPIVIKSSDKNNYYLNLSQADGGVYEPFIKYISNNLLDSIGIYERAIAGEDIEEQSDLNKKLSLFKKKIESDKNYVSIKKNRQILKGYYSSSVEPMINKLYSTLDPFKDFFISKTELYYDNNSDKLNVQYENITTSILNIMENDVLSHNLHTYNLTNFKNKDNLFNICVYIYVYPADYELKVFVGYLVNFDIKHIFQSSRFYQLLQLSNGISKKYDKFIEEKEYNKILSKLGNDLYDLLEYIYEGKSFHTSDSIDEIFLRELIFNVFADKLNGILEINKILPSVKFIDTELQIEVSEYYRDDMIKFKEQMEIAIMKDLNRKYKFLQPIFIKIIFTEIF